MGLNLLSVEDTPAFDHNVETLTKETCFVRDQSAMLSAAVQAYGEALDPRLRRAPPIGLGSGLAHLTAPFLEVLGRSNEAAGSPWDNSDKRLADALEYLINPETTDDVSEMAHPLAVSMGAPMLQPLADTMRTVGAMRESLSLKTLDMVATKLNRFVTDDLDSVVMAHHSYTQRKNECDLARSAFLSLPRWVADSERDELQGALDDAKHTLDAARARLVLALCNADGKRRYALIETVRTMMDDLHTFFKRASQEMEQMKPLLDHLGEYEQQARQQAEQKMAAQAAQLNAFQDAAATTEADHSERSAEAAAAKGGGGEGSAPNEGRSQAGEPSEQGVGCQPHNTLRGVDAAAAAAAAAKDMAIRQALTRGSQTASGLGQQLIKQGYLLKLCGSTMERCYFVLDCKGALAYNHGPADATRLLLSPGTSEAGGGGGGGGGGGLLLPIAQGAVDSTVDVARSAWGFISAWGRGGGGGGNGGNGGNGGGGGGGGEPPSDGAPEGSEGAAPDEARATARLARPPMRHPEKAGDGRHGTVDLIVSTVKLDSDSRVTQDLPYCFRIISPTQKLTLQAESEGERAAWVEALQGVIAELLTAAASGPPEAADGGTGGGTSGGATVLQAVREARGNERCAECGARDPDWAVINRGMVVCQQCAGAHRSLGTHISKVRHITLDTDAWTAPLKALFQRTGNAQGNAIWQGGTDDIAAEASIFTDAALNGGDDLRSDSGEKLSDDGVAHGEYMISRGMSAADRHLLVRAKYEEKVFMDADASEQMLEEGAAALVQAAKSGAVDKAMHLLAAGAEVNGKAGGGETALHAACSQGDIVMAQLLLLNGADPTCVDEWGLSPLEVAKLSADNTALVELLQLVLRQRISGPLPTTEAPTTTLDEEEWEDIQAGTADTDDMLEAVGYSSDDPPQTPAPSEDPSPPSQEVATPSPARMVTPSPARMVEQESSADMHQEASPAKIAVIAEVDSSSEPTAAAAPAASNGPKAGKKKKSKK